MFGIGLAVLTICLISLFYPRTCFALLVALTASQMGVSPWLLLIWMPFCWISWWIDVWSIHVMEIGIDASLPDDDDVETPGSRNIF